MADIKIPIQEHLAQNTPLDLGKYFSSIIGVVFTVAAIATFGFLVMAGLQWITAGGDTKKIEAASARITGAIIGLAIVAVSWALFMVIDTFFGLNVVK